MLERVLGRLALELREVVHVLVRLSTGASGERVRGWHAGTAKRLSQVGMKAFGSTASVDKWQCQLNRWVRAEGRGEGSLAL
eukprot:6192421-Pleurochrysis_carterae.AAC.1